MTREEQNQAQALDLEERRRESEEALEILFEFCKPFPAGSSFDFALRVCAFEMGISEFYRKLKDGR